MLWTCGLKNDLVEVYGISKEQVEQQASRFDPVMLTQDIVILEELRRTARQSQAARALLDATVVRLALAEQFTPIAQLIGQDSVVTADSAAKKKS
jgi:DNA polymerase III gamma/tau subunit